MEEQRKQGIADVINQFKRNAPSSYNEVVCDSLRSSARLRVGVSWTASCNEAQYNGSNWYELGSAELRYPNNGTIQLWSDGRLLFSGTPMGSTVKEIEWMGCDNSTRECTKPIWVRVYSDFMIAYSSDRPVNDAYYTPSAPYFYIHFRAK